MLHSLRQRLLATTALASMAAAAADCGPIVIPLAPSRS